MKKKLKINRIIGGAFLAVGIIFATLVKVSEALGILGFFLLVIGAIWLVIVSNISKKYCDKCGEKLTGCAYSYREKNRKMDANSLRVNVEIKCTCPHCGAQKTFVKTFSVNENSDNLQYQVDNYCEKTFGY